MNAGYGSYANGVTRAWSRVIDVVAIKIDGSKRVVIKVVVALML